LYLGGVVLNYYIFAGVSEWDYTFSLTIMMHVQIIGLTIVQSASLLCQKKGTHAEDQWNHQDKAKIA